MRTRTYHRTPKDPFVKTQFNYFGASSSTRQKSVKKVPQDRRDNEIPTHNVSAQENTLHPQTKKYTSSLFSKLITQVHSLAKFWKQGDGIGSFAFYLPPFGIQNTTHF